MLSYFPEPIRQKIMNLLQADNFLEAKSVYDTWLKDNPAIKNKISKSKLALSLLFYDA